MSTVNRFAPGGCGCHTYGGCSCVGEHLFIEMFTGPPECRSFQPFDWLAGAWRGRIVCQQTTYDIVVHDDANGGTIEITVNGIPGAGVAFGDFCRPAFIAYIGTATSGPLFVFTE